MQKLFFILLLSLFVKQANAQSPIDTIVLFNNSYVAGQVVKFQFDTLYIESNNTLEKHPIGSIRSVAINAANPLKSTIEKAVLTSGYKSNSSSIIISQRSRALSKYSAGHYLRRSSGLFIGAGIVSFIGGIVTGIILTGDDKRAAPYVIGITGGISLGLSIGGVVNLGNAGNALEQGNIGSYQYAK